MADPIAVIVGKLEVWVSSIFNEVKRVDREQHELRSEVDKNCKELIDKDNRQEIMLAEIMKKQDMICAGCEKREAKCAANFNKVARVLKDHGTRIPNDREIEEQKEQKKKVGDIAGKVKWAAGWIAGILFLLAVLKYMGKI